LDGTVAAFDDITLKGAPRSRVVISVKFGALRDPAGGSSGNDGRPRAVWESEVSVGEGSIRIHCG
jgi:hypothetical protein